MRSIITASMWALVSGAGTGARSIDLFRFAIITADGGRSTSIRLPVPAGQLLRVLDRRRGAKRSGSLQLLRSGDVTFDGSVKYTGANNDRDPILVEIGGAVPTNTISSYSSGDVNLDGTIKYTGVANDRDPVLVTIGSSVPSNVRHEQLP